MINIFMKSPCASEDPTQAVMVLEYGNVLTKIRGLNGQKVAAAAVIPGFPDSFVRN